MSRNYITDEEDLGGPVGGIPGGASEGVYARLDIAPRTETEVDGSVIRMGVAATPLINDTASAAGFIVGYFDCGAANGWPAGLYIHTDVTGTAGLNFTALQGDATLKTACAIVTGVECFMDFSSAGRVTGSLSVVQGTVAFGNFALPGAGGGVYRAACFNIKGGGSSSDPTKAQRISCIELKTGDGTFATNKDFELFAAGYAIYFSGFTAAAGVTNILSSTRLAELPASTIGIRVGVGAEGASGTAYYIPLVLATEWN